jgi:NitT/TauT family transport system permease protein
VRDRLPLASRGVVVAWQLAVAVVLIGGWEAGVRAKVLDPFFVSRPTAIAQRMLSWLATGSVWGHLAVTLEEAFLGLVAGAVLGIGLGFGLARWPLAARVADPYIKMLNAVPRVVLAPLFLLWFGLGIWSKVALGVTLVFFVVFFNVFQGIREVSPVLLANARMLGASRRQLIHRVYIPSALSWVFSSLHLSVGLAFVGAVIGEYLGSSAGVGYLILEAEGTFDIETVIAGVILLTAFALMLDYLISIVETSLLKWQAK